MINTPESSKDLDRPDEIAKWFAPNAFEFKKFYKPVLDEFSVELVRHLCEALDVSSEVFITSVDVIEEYLRLKTLDNYTVIDCLSIIVSAIFLSVKFITTHHDVNLTSLQEMVAKICKHGVPLNTFRTIELDILATIKNVPARTASTSVAMLLKYYGSIYSFIKNLEPLCMEILNVVYISKASIITKLKDIYAPSPNATKALEVLIKNPLFYPAGVVLCAIKLTKYKGLYGLEILVRDLSEFIGIHSDHIKILSAVFLQLITD